MLSGRLKYIIKKYLILLLGVLKEIINESLLASHERNIFKNNR
jgi:hypothetical protein